MGIGRDLGREIVERLVRKGRGALREGRGTVGRLLRRARRLNMNFRNPRLHHLFLDPSSSHQHFLLIPLTPTKSNTPLSLHLTSESRPLCLRDQLAGIVLGSIGRRTKVGYGSCVRRREAGRLERLSPGIDVGRIEFEGGRTSRGDEKGGRDEHVGNLGDSDLDGKDGGRFGFDGAGRERFRGVFDGFGFGRFGDELGLNFTQWCVAVICEQESVLGSLEICNRRYSMRIRGGRRLDVVYEVGGGVQDVARGEGEAKEDEMRK